MPARHASQGDAGGNFVPPAGGLNLRPKGAEMAHTKAKGSSKLGRDSQAKRLGIKKIGGQTVKPGNIIVRQRGTKYHAGENVALGKDFTIFSMTDGKVEFKNKKIMRYDSQLKNTTVVSVVKTGK